MDAKAQVIKLLRGREAKRIRFRFPGGAGAVTVPKTAFETVAAAIDAGTVTVDPATSLPAGAAAQYFGSSNSIRVPSILGRVQEAHVLHESLHCYFDLVSSNVQDVADEAAAYVVSDLYAKMTGLKDSRFSGPIYDKARPIAVKLLKHEASGSHTIPDVDPTDWVGLRTAVLAHPVYSSLTPTSTLYTHNG